MTGAGVGIFKFVTSAEGQNEYDRVFDLLKIHDVAASPINKHIEKMEKDKTRCGTAIFQYDSAAVGYYREYGIGRDEVMRKIRDGEIHICLDPIQTGQEITENGVKTRIAAVKGEWDADRRWFTTEHPLLPITRRQQATMSRDRCNIVDQLASISWAKNFLRRAEASSDDVVEFKSMTMLERKIREISKRPWASKLPYCMAGRPHYRSHEYNEVHFNKANNRIVKFTCGDFDGLPIKWRFVILRKIGEPTGTHWGLRDVGFEFGVIVDSPHPSFRYVSSIADVIRLIKMESTIRPRNQHVPSN